FASGTVAGPRTRRYHALLLHALKPPTERLVLVNGFEAWLATAGGELAIASQRYTPDVTHPDGPTRLATFTTEPWPTWVFASPDGTRVSQEILVPRGHSSVLVVWRLLEGPGGASLRVRPFLSGRDYHSLHHENPAFRFDAAPIHGGVSWTPYRGIPDIESRFNGTYRHEPVWYRNFQYDEERERGLDFSEDLASPGEIRWDLRRGEAWWWLAVAPASSRSSIDPEDEVARIRAREKARRARVGSPLLRAAESYLVERRARPGEAAFARSGTEKQEPPAREATQPAPVPASMTLVAGYPWFTDWGRDTFVSLRGLCLATGRVETALGILLAWSGSISDGMIPNRYPDSGEQPEYNSVDASLWFVVAAHELLLEADRRGLPIDTEARRTLERAVRTILEGYAAGTRHGIRMTEDGLLACGEPGVQLTWMDAKVGDWVVTPRIGKPVEVQALWINALWIGSRIAPRWRNHLNRARDSFRQRFWNEKRRCLFDVVDADHVAGRNDGSLRPNQILAVGGLPLALLQGERARWIVETVEDRLLTPMGLRTLAPAEPGYAPRYAGGVRERDGAYHQGTVWPWLLGPFTEAWLRVNGSTAERREQARHRFLQPLMEHLQDAGFGHVSEIADAEPPHTPRGCPWQAWSLAELIRLDRRILAEPPPSPRPSHRPGKRSLALAVV
ncbi:MAG: glycogen debranching enzyme family protein, partial [Verrucomicrobiales bacterium]|nr:glycogen debranching enzyme family protein [Verrucomicrobiales bacterium]